MIPALRFVCLALAAQLVTSLPILPNFDNPDYLFDESKGIVDVVGNLTDGVLHAKCTTNEGIAGKCTFSYLCSSFNGKAPTSCPSNPLFKCCPTEETRSTLPPKIKDCGVRPLKTSNLIVGGIEAIPHSWPWAVALYRVNNGRKSFSCGATIIHQRYILCAAHCVHRNFGTLAPSDFTIKIGAHNLTNSGRFVEVDKVIAHESYSPRYHNDDIALLRLKEPLVFGTDSDIAPVCLPELNSNSGRQVGEMTTMVGWGVHSQTSYTPSSSLYEVLIPTYNMNKCQQAYDDLMGSNNQFKWKNVICAAYDQGGKDTCQGDSGGPMMIASQDAYQQIGVVSFGYGCAQAGYPGVYTYVPNYINWIGNHIR